MEINYVLLDKPHCQQVFHNLEGQNIINNSDITFQLRNAIKYDVLFVIFQYRFQFPVMGPACVAAQREPFSLPGRVLNTMGEARAPSTRLLIYY